MIRHLEELVQRAAEAGPRRMAVAWAHDAHTVKAAHMAFLNGIARPVLYGDRGTMLALCDSVGADPSEFVIIHCPDEETAAQTAVRSVHEGQADMLMKGLVSTDRFMRAILNRDWGLRPQGRTLSHVGVFEIPAYHKLVTVSDVAVIPAPDLSQKVIMAGFLAETAALLGIRKPKIACIAPTEKNLPKIQSCADAAELCGMGRQGLLGDVLIDGPISLDIAMSSHAASAKGMSDSPVAGDADCLLFPNIESANVFYKCCTKLAGAELACMVAGTSSPCVLPSRGDSAESKLYSIALACLQAAEQAV